MPRRSIRLRLTMLYGGLFLLSGTGLLVIMYVLSQTVFVVPPAPTGLFPQPLPPLLETSHWLDQAVAQAAVALAIMSVLAVGLGWLMAGRILRPLRLMTATTRFISADNLHQRLAVQGPDDELKDLGDTIDGLLARLETAFDAQKRFVANASHELRTPLTLERTMIEVALADPDASAGTLRATCEELLTVGQQQERLIEALLTLAHSQQGLAQRTGVDLATITALVLRRPSEPPISAALSPAATVGDPRLIERLVANLVDNALRYNTVDGQVTVTTWTRAWSAVVSVTNTGPPVPAEEIERLLQPFQRMTADRTGEHSGLGLSIVAAIAKAHNAILTIRPGPAGGLHVEVAFPVRPNHPTVD
jgi:signal transduction histidine kinase